MWVGSRFLACGWFGVGVFVIADVEGVGCLVGE